MGAQINHAVFKTLIDHGRHGNEQLPVKISIATGAAFEIIDRHTLKVMPAPICGKGQTRACDAKKDQGRALTPLLPHASRLITG